MATYKVIQDIEAEDKLLGPLTLRQFIYGLVSAFFLYICFIVVTRGAPVLLIAFFPPAAFCGFFAFPFMQDQPTEVWALAKIRFLFMPRRRIWNQSGVKQLVTITVPKKIERVLTDGLSQNEVRSRLSALANTLDSRGWAVKNVNVNLYNQMAITSATVSSDRLIDMNSIPQQVPSYDIQAADDILDEHNNPVAQQFEQMINASAQAHRQQLINTLNSPAVPTPVQTTTDKPADYWFMQQPGSAAAGPVMPMAMPVAQDETPEEESLIAQIKSHRDEQDSVMNSHLRTLQPIDEQAANAPKPAPTPSPVTPDPAILSLANNNDLNVATLAREANKSKGSDEPGNGEVVVSLR
ncbi:MAG: hypothetical protein JWO41_144 [Candidatus Saccharibacteria bacterium]|nr:hypothetical protein [Candidatus Saccharibacteria bacterium]